MRRLKQYLKRFLCFLNGGHYSQIQRSNRRIWLECEDCGYKSPGWEVRDGIYKKPSRIASKQGHNPIQNFHPNLQEDY